MEPNPDLVMRAAHVSDAAPIAQMSRLHVEHGLNWRWTPSRVRRYIRDPEAMVLVASAGGELAGFSIMHFGDDHGHLLLLAVEPRRRRVGIGMAMLAWLEKSARTAGLRRIRLEVRSTNRAALYFYTRTGYERQGRVEGYYDAREAAVVMTKVLVAQDYARS